MAYITKEQTAKFRLELKKEFPTKEGWKFSVRISHHSSVIVTILEAPINFNLEGRDYKQVNSKWISEHWGEGPDAIALQRITDICNEGNFDNSDSMTDYFHVGWYFTLNIGTWDKPFKYVAKKFKLKLDAEPAAAPAVNPGPALEEPAAVYITGPMGDRRRVYAKNETAAQTPAPIKKRVTAGRVAPAPAPAPQTERAHIEKIQHFALTGLFPSFNKNNTLEEYTEQLSKTGKEAVMIDEIIYLNNADYDHFKNSLMDSRPWLKGKGTYYKMSKQLCAALKKINIDQKSARICPAIYSPGRPALLVDPSGHDYARYVGFLDKIYIKKFEQLAEKTILG